MTCFFLEGCTGGRAMEFLNDVLSPLIPDEGIPSLSSILEGTHQYTFDSKRSDLLSPQVLASFTDYEIRSKLVDIENELGWLFVCTDVWGNGNVFEMLNTRNSFMLCPERIESIEDYDSVIKHMAKKKMIILRLFQIISLKYEDTDEVTELKSRALDAFTAYSDMTTGHLRFVQALLSTSNPSEIPDQSENPEYTFSFPDHFGKSLANTTQVFVWNLWGELVRAGLRRVGDDCYEEIKVNGHRTHAWRRCKTIKEFIFDYGSKSYNSQQWKRMTSSTGCAKHAENLLKSSSDHEFPEVHPDRNYISFRNGIYHLRSDTFYVYGEGALELDANIVSMNFIDNDFNVDFGDREAVDILTPDVDLIFTTQGYDEDTLQWAYAMLGRLLYDVGELDNWQVGVFIKGIAGSGKSTIATLMKSIFPKRMVGTLSSNIEEKFGLSSLHDKFIYVCSEVKKNFALDQGDWQSMISGEEVSVPIKGETAKSIVWRTPGLLCGNELPGWIDAAGSVVRRLVMFEFSKKVKAGNRDPNLIDKMKREIGSFIAKINKSYLKAVSEHGKKAIWTPGVLSKQLHEYHLELKSEVDNLTAFIESEHVKLDSECSVKHDEFQKRYALFVQDLGGRQTSKKNTHYKSVLKEHGCHIVRKETTNSDGKKIREELLEGLCFVNES